MYGHNGIEKCNSGLGFYGIDSPDNLFNMVLDKMAEEVGDVVILNGDFIGHNRAAEPTDD